MKCGVPSTSPSMVIRVRLGAPAMPKSMILARVSSSSRMTLAGLRSRWITPARWASARPAIICSSSGPALCHRIAPPALSAADSVRPSSSSMTMYGQPSWSPKSMTSTTPGCEISESSWASRSMRLVAQSSWRPMCSARRILIATRLPIEMWRPRQTSPAAPRSIGDSRRYLPSSTMPSLGRNARSDRWLPTPSTRTRWYDVALRPDRKPGSRRPRPRALAASHRPAGPPEPPLPYKTRAAQGL